MANTEVGSAYLSIFAKIDRSFGRTISGAVGSAGKAFGDLATRAAMVTAAATAAAGAGLVAVGKMALDSYASYEQLTGGVDKLYGSASGKLQAYASQAYRTAGMSANQYMEQATSFSAAMINSLGGDVDKAADMTDVAMRAMSDNVNVFGSNMTDVQNAFQGFAKQNYTMLDNLKLGYGGTKTEMQRLIDDANEYAESIGEAGDMSIDSFSDIVRAIELIQEKQHIAGTTAEEAADTIEGSINQAKAAWQNWLTALANPDADLDEITGQLVDSVITAAENIIPRIGVIASSIGTVIADQMPGVVREIGAALYDALPPEMQRAVDYVLPGLKEAFGNIAPAVKQMVEDVSAQLEPLMKALEPVAEAWGKAVGPASELLASVIGLISPFVEGIVKAFGETLAPELEELGEHFASLCEHAAPVIDALQPVASLVGESLVDMIAFAVEAIDLLVQVIDDLVKSGTDLYDFFTGAGDASEAMSSAFDGASGIVVAAISPLPGIVLGIFGAVQQVAQTAWAAITSVVSDAVSAVVGVVGGVLSSVVGIVSGIFGAVQSAVSAAWGAIQSVVSGAVGAVKGVIGGLSSIVGSVSSTFNSVRDAITRPIQAAVSTVRNMVSRIKGMFPLSIGRIMDNIRLPRINVNGGSAPFGIGGKGSLPSFSVSWGAKGGFLDNPTLIGAGEAGPELLLPKSGRLMNDFSDAVASRIEPRGTTSTINVYIDGARINDDAAIQGAFYDIMDMLFRKGYMNRG